MFTLTVDDKRVRELIKALPDVANRAAEIALDETARDIKKAEVAEMKRVFASPTSYTLKSLKMTPTHNHNMQAVVWFKDPDRMSQHYLVPQVEGGPRKFKGFEQAFGNTMFVPGQAARMTKAGNISQGQIRQILSVLGRAERTAGYSANITTRSAKRNKAPRDYVYITERHGKLYPGIYKRFAKGSGAVKSGNYQSRQLGSNRVAVRDERGRFIRWKRPKQRSKYRSAIRARGLRPIMLVGKQQASIKPLLDFYEVAAKVHKKNFAKHFDREFNKRLAS